MKKRIPAIAIVVAAIAAVAFFGSCSKERTCKCDPTTATEHWQLITVDRSMKCSQITKIAKEHKVDMPDGHQSLDKYDVVPVSCIDYDE